MKWMHLQSVSSDSVCVNVRHKTSRKLVDSSSSFWGFSVLHSQSGKCQPLLSLDHWLLKGPCSPDLLNWNPHLWNVVNRQVRKKTIKREEESGKVETRRRETVGSQGLKAASGEEASERKITGRWQINQDGQCDSDSGRAFVFSSQMWVLWVVRSLFRWEVTTQSVRSCGSPSLEIRQFTTHWAETGKTLN